MKITDIHGDKIVIGKTSITVKDDSGKTRGIVTNCRAFEALQPRDKFAFHKAGISLDEAKNCILCNGEIYYLNNQRLEKWIEAQNHPDFFAAEREKVTAQKAIAEKMQERGFNVIDCIFG